jgi:cytochrome P450 family 138
MSDGPTREAQATTIVDVPATTRAVKLPPGPRLPKLMQGIGYAVSRKWTAAHLARRYGDAFTMNVPVFGRMVVVASPQLAKQLFMANADDVGNIQPNLSRVFGKGSVFALDRADHRLRRKLLTPPFHGKSIKNYENIFEEETLREIANWPEGQSFPTLEPMMRIMLNAILRAVFGADGEQLDELRRIIPPWVTLGSRVAVLPTPMRTYGRYGPWGRLAEYRRQYDDVLDRLIDLVKADPNFDSRDDVLALLLRSRYEDGSEMSRNDIGDELLTLLAAGHGTTASTLGWTFERISRHPGVLAKLVDEAATNDSEYRSPPSSRCSACAPLSTSRADTSTRRPWNLANGISRGAIRLAWRSLRYTIVPRSFPTRSGSTRSASSAAGRQFAFVPFGGGTRRCVGAAFANVEMDVVLRTVLRHFIIDTTTATGEKTHSRGIAYTPKDGGRIIVHRRETPLG